MQRGDLTASYCSAKLAWVVDVPIQSSLWNPQMHAFIPNRKWSYIEPAGNRNPADPNAPVTVVMTEAQIIDEYFPHWSAGMIRIGKGAEVTIENCIEDWIVVHWAGPHVD